MFSVFMRSPFFLVVTAATALAVLSASACGSRTGLLGPEDLPAATVDATIDRVADATRDASHDGDARPTLPPIDANGMPDVFRADCPDPTATLVYVVTSDNQLLSYFPPTSTFRTIGTIACPGATTTAPFSMAIDRRGIAYVLMLDGRLFRVSPRDARCEATPYVGGQQGFQSFGMGFATRELGPDETLFLAGNGRDGSAAGLASLSVTDFRVAPIGMFSADVASAELTGTGDGRLFGFYSRMTTMGSYIGEFEKSTARVIAETALPMVDQGRAWAFAFWGGDFYMFVAPTGTPGSMVVRYRASDSTVAPVGAWTSPIVGAGVSTCAPP